MGKIKSLEQVVKEGGNVTQTAKDLNIERRHLYYLLKKGGREIKVIDGKIYKPLTKHKRKGEG